MIFIESCKVFYGHNYVLQVFDNPNLLVLQSKRQYTYIIVGTIVRIFKRRIKLFILTLIE